MSYKPCDRSALGKAEYYLGYKPRTEEEVRHHLLRKQYEITVVEEVLRYLKDQNYLNDRTYAEQAVQSALSRHIGPSRIVADLRRRGVNSETVTAAMQGLSSETEIEIALEFANRKAAAMGGLDPLVRTRRLSAALHRRGFSYGTIRVILSQYIEGQNPV